MTTRHPLPRRVAAEVRKEMARQDRSVPELAVVLEVGAREAQRCYDGMRELGLEELPAVARWLAVPIAQLTTGCHEREDLPAR